MDTIATTRMSSKGQVVIPETIRKRLNLQAGAQFVVLGEGDVVILKAISTTSESTLGFGTNKWALTVAMRFKSAKY
mgnify:CR=1 FL=1